MRFMPQTYCWWCSRMQSFWSLLQLLSLCELMTKIRLQVHMQEVWLS